MELLTLLADLERKNLERVTGGKYGVYIGLPEDVKMPIFYRKATISCMDLEG